MAIVFDATLHAGVTNAASVTTSAAAASGSRIFLFIWDYDPAAVCTGASGGGLTWVVDHTGNFSADGGTHVWILSADAPSGLASSTVITPAWSTGVDFGPGMAVHSWTGLATGASGYVDATSTEKNDFLESWTGNNIVTTTADTLIFGFSVGPAASQTHTAVTNWDERHDWFGEGNNRCAIVSRVVSAAGTYNPAGTWNITVDFQSNVGIAYKIGSTGPPPQKIDPDADTDVAGWVTSPLYSKLNDASDSTFAQDGLV
jgi:hypothetical protein